MATRREERETKKALRRARRQAQEAPVKQAIAAHKAAAKKARALRREKLEKARGECKARKERVSIKANEQFKHEVAKAREKRKATKQAARTACAVEAEKIKSEAAKEIAEARKNEREERNFHRSITRTEQWAARRQKPRATASERRRESDDEVLANLSVTPEYIPLWKRIKGSIKGDAYKSRTEQFLHYVHEHPDEVYAAQEAEVEREIRAYYDEEARFYADRAAKELEEEGGLLDDIASSLAEIAA